MIKPKFTPGPWRVLDNTSYDDRKYNYQILDKEGYNIANIEDCLDEEEQANAVLMAAAPEMAECLLDVLDEIEHDEIPVRDRPASFLKIVKVLAKAGFKVFKWEHME